VAVVTREIKKSKFFSLRRTLYLAATTLPHKYFPACSISLEKVLQKL